MQLERACRLKWLHVYVHICVFQVTASKGEQLSWERIFGDVTLGCSSRPCWNIYRAIFENSCLKILRGRTAIYSCPLYTCYTTCALCRVNGEDMKRRWTHERVALYPDSYSLRGSKPRKMDCYSELKLSRGWNLKYFCLHPRPPHSMSIKSLGCRWKPMNNKRVSTRNGVAVNR